ncbi:MAG: DUF5060 domain-containing protein [Planctomycetota bacterium]
MTIGQPQIQGVAISAPSVPCFERVEVSFSLVGDFDNPFDPRQIQVDGRFTRPDGKEVVMPAFLYQDCQRRLAENGGEVVEKISEPCWKVRFAPTSPGAWQVAVAARDRSGAASSDPIRFEATPSKAHGYIRLAAGADYFHYDDGAPFFIIGENIAWAGKRGTYDFDDWLPAAGKAGMNLARIWLQWGSILCIEHKGTGAGRYDLANAWRMDHVLDLARQHGVRVLFTCDSPEPYQKEHYWLGKLTSKPWENCPHNAANGGPLKEPAEFYTTEEGHRLIRQRLRYIVARWGWDPNIFCWELWNELNVFPGWNKLVPEIARWHIEMAGVLRDLDPNRHLVTTSFCNPEGDEGIWKLKELDFVQSHSYSGRDMAALLPEITRRMKERYSRPHIFGEFGCRLTGTLLRGPSSVFEMDAKGVYLHNAIWSTALSGGAGTPLTWWWDNYIHAKNLYPIFTPLAKFCDQVPWTTAGFKPAQASFSWTSPPKLLPPRDLVLSCDGHPPFEGRLILDPSKSLDSTAGLSLQGTNHKDQQKPILLELDRTAPGPMVLRIGRVWILGVLEVKLDGKPILREEFPAGPGAGPWAKSELDKRWNIWGADYDKDISVEIPAGKHTVEMFNTGKDSIAIDRITLPGYLTGLLPAARCIGLIGDSMALLWIQNADHNLAAILDRREVLPVEGAKVAVEGVPAGECTVEWWDTTAGTILRTTRERSSPEGLVLELPPIASDIALKVLWRKGT